MSNWINIKSEDIEIDEKNGELSFYVWSDSYSGSVYAVLKIKDLKKFLKSEKEYKEKINNQSG